MILFIIVLVLIICFVLSDLVPIFKKKKWKIFWIYSILMGMALIMNILIFLNFKMPIISVALKKLLGVFFNF